METSVPHGLSGGSEPEAEGHPEVGRPRGRSSAWRVRLSTFLRRHVHFGWAALVFAVTTVVAFRAGLIGGASDLPQGTNALNAGLDFWFQARHSPLDTWLYAFTDWGQPFPGFTGPSVGLIFVALGPATGVRVEECVAWFLAGLSIYAVSRRLGATPLASIAAGVYYQLATETAQFFEGHVSAMWTLAIGPLFLLALYELLKAPSFRWAFAAGSLLYLISSTGDLGVLYFFVVFAALLSAFMAVRGLLARRYRWRDLGPIGVGLGTFVLTMTTWWYPYALGARPQFTTLIVTNTIPFSGTDGADGLAVVTGVIKEKAFLVQSYGQHSYAAGGMASTPFFLLLPILILVTLYLWGNRYRWSLFAAAALAMIFATGPSYPGIATFNRWAYQSVPFFDTIPALFRWEVIAVLAYSLLLALGLSDWEKGRPRLRPLRFWTLLQPRSSSAESHPVSERRWRIPSARPGALRALRPALALGVVAIAVLQNAAVVYEPPGFFHYGPAYIGSVPFLEHQPHYGEVLAIPFGGIYENTTGTGLTESSLLMLPYYTGTDAIVFEAGTPYSLALDKFVGDGLTFGYSRNMTGFLAGVNVQYVVSTHYPNWDWIHSGEYAPSESFAALANQTGLTLVNASGYQSVYGVSNFTGNVSFHPKFVLYYGPPSLLYSLLEDPTFPGPNAEPFVDGGSTPDSATLASHASRIEIDSASLASIPVATLRSAESGSVQVRVVVRGAEFAPTPPGPSSPPSAGSAGSGAIWAGPAWAQLATGFDWAALSAAGYRSGNLVADAACPLGGNVTIALGGVGRTVSFPAATPSATKALNLSAAGFATTSSEGGPIPYPGSVQAVSLNNSTALHWSFVSNASYTQSLDLHAQNLSAYNTLEVDYQGASIPTRLSLGFGGSVATTAGAATTVPIGGNTTRVSYYFPSGNLPAVPVVGSHMSQLDRVSIDLPSTGAQSSWTITKIHLLEVPVPTFARVPLGSWTLPSSGPLSLVSPEPCEIVSTTLDLGPPSPPALVPWTRGLTAIPDPTLVSTPALGSGWGLVMLAQTFSPLWSLDAGPGPAPIHVVANVGLNAWLVNPSGSGFWKVVYLGNDYEGQSAVLEGVAGSVLAAAVVTVRFAVRRKG